MRWLDAQTHRGENIGKTATHVVFVELKSSAGGDADRPSAILGPAS